MIEEKPEEEQAPDVNSFAWHEMSSDALYKQLNVLTDRYNIAVQLKHVELAKQMKIGVDYLTEYLKLREAKDKPRISPIIV